MKIFSHSLIQVSIYPNKMNKSKTKMRSKRKRVKVKPLVVGVVLGGNESREVVFRVGS